MESTLVLSLPRERMTIPVARRMCAGMLRVLGVLDAVVGDLEIVISEACSNVVRHAEEGNDYQVTFRLCPQHCEVDVTDRGGGFAHLDLVGGDADTAAESGRGVLLMRALVDDIDFSARPGANTVRLSKRLAFATSSPGELLLEDGGPGPAAPSRLG